MTVLVAPTTRMLRWREMLTQSKDGSVLALKIVHHVRTPEGVRHYHAPIGTPIVADIPDLTPDQDRHLDALRDHPVNRLLGQKFAAAGHPLFLVGGSVRDALGGHPDFADLDYTTDATPEQIHTIVDPLGPTWGIGEEFGTVGIQIQGLKTEITTFRAERYDEASRKPVVVFGTNIGDDLARRDLTMNAMALTMSSDGAHPVGSLVDPYDGAADLAAGILRTPDDPHKSMSEDPLRQLRVVRFAAKRDAKPDPELRQAIIDLHDRLAIVSPERKTAELRKILDGGPEVTARAMQLAGELKVADDLFGGLNVSRFNVSDVANLPPGSDPITILALLAFRLDSDAAARRMTAMRLSNEEIRPAIDAARLAGRMAQPGGAIEARQLVRSTDEATLQRARVIAFTTRIDGPMRRRVESVLADPALTAALRGPLPIDGNDLVAAGLSGPAVGAALRKVTDAFLANPQLTRAQAVAVAGIAEADHKFISYAAAIPTREADSGYPEHMQAAYLDGLPTQEGTRLLRDDANRAAAKAEVARKIFDRLDDDAKRQLAEDVASNALERIRDMVPGYIEVAKLDSAEGDRLLATLTDPFDPRLVWVKKEYNPSDTAASGWDWAAPWHDNIERLLDRRSERRYPDVPPEGLTWVSENGRDSGRTFHFKRGNDLALRDELALSAVSDFIHSWASTSNDSNERALAIQDAITLEFDLDHAMGWVNTFDPSPDQLEGHQRQVAKQQANIPLYRQMIRAMYDNTQEWLAANGIKEVLVYRGMTWLHKDDGLPPDWFDKAEDGTLIPAPPLRPASSWAYGRELAEAFAAFSGSFSDTRPRSSALLSAVVPASAILATPRSGFGCLPEEELVILTFGGEVRVELRRPAAETKSAPVTAPLFGRAYAGNLTHKDGAPSPADPDSTWAACPVCASTGHLPRTGVCLSCKGRGGDWEARETKSFLHRVRTPAGREQFGQEIGEIIHPDVVPDVVPRARVTRPLPPVRDFSAWGERGRDIDQLARVIDRAALDPPFDSDKPHDVPLATQKALTEIFHYHDRQTGLTQDPSQFVRLGPGRWQVAGNIQAEDGNDAGTFEKVVDFGQEPPGAFHGLIHLWDKYQGKGFGERLLRHEENAYIATGVDHIDLLAGLTGGGYAWARAGFDWHQSPGAYRAPWFDVRRRMEQRLMTASPEEKHTLLDLLGQFDEADEYDDVTLAPTPAEIAQLPSGKQILRGSEWEARKTLVPPLVLAGKALTDAQLDRARRLAAAAEAWWKECQARGFDLGDDGLDWAPGTSAETKAVAGIETKVKKVRTPEGRDKYHEEIGMPIVPHPHLPAHLAFAEQGPSPLDYSSSTWARPDRLAIVDSTAGEHPRGDFGFAELRSPSYYGPSGRRLKKPRIDVTPGAAPDTIGFVDYSMDRGFLKIHYMKTRKDRGGQGVATHLLTQLIETHTVPGEYVDFGKLMNETSARLYEKMQARFPDRKFTAKIYYKSAADDPDLETKKKPKKVKTRKGVEKYHAPIGTPIIPHPDLPLTPRPGSRENPWKVSSASRAVELLALGDHVQLSRPKHAATLVKELRKVAKAAEERGETAPTFDLCKVTVKDTSLFCVHSKGIPRVHMPQLTGIPIPGSRADNLLRDAKGKVDLAPYFLEHLAKHGAIVHHDLELASRLIASQNELDGAKVGRMMRRIKKGEQVRELFVSDDNYIVDGHHHWAATIGLDVSNDIEGELHMRVARVDMGIVELLALANEFAAEWGVAPRAVDTKAATAVDHVRTPEGARRYDLPIGAPIVLHPRAVPQPWQRNDYDVRSAGHRHAFDFADAHFTMDGGPTATERKGLRQYQEFGYRRINAQLRSGHFDPTVLADLQRYDRTMTVGVAVKSIDVALARSTVDSDVVVYRGVGLGAARDMADTAEFTDDGYVSTSMLEDIAVGFGNVAEIHVPAGSHALSLDAAGVKPRGGSKEHEVLLPRGARFRVDAVEDRGGEGFGPYRFMLTYLGSEPQTVTYKTAEVPDAPNTADVPADPAERFAWAPGEIRVHRRRSSVLDALATVVEAKTTRHVRTPAGVEQYHEPIGSPIIPRPSVPSIPLPSPALPSPALPSPDPLDNDVSEMTEKARRGQLDGLTASRPSSYRGDGFVEPSEMEALLNSDEIRGQAKIQIADDIATRLDLEHHPEWRAQIWGQESYGGWALGSDVMNSETVWRLRTHEGSAAAHYLWQRVGTESEIGPTDENWGFALPAASALTGGHFVSAAPAEGGFEYRRGDDPVVHHDMDVWGVSNLVAGWARTSNDHDPDALVMQEAIAAEFGIPDDQQAPWDLVEAQYIGGVVSPRRVDKYSSTVASGSFATHEEAAAASEAAMAPYRERLPLYRAFARAQYDATQQWYKDHGITHIEVFRGMKWEYDAGEAEPPAWYRAVQAQILASQATSPETRRITRGMTRTDQIVLRPASAWSYSHSMAGQFSGGGNSTKHWAVLRTVIPVERILSNARTGFGCLPEEEVVVIGGPGEYEVVVNMADDKGYGVLVGRDAAKAVADETKSALTAVRKVRTPEGSRRYHRPIGSPIVAHPAPSLAIAGPGARNAPGASQLAGVLAVHGGHTLIWPHSEPDLDAIVSRGQVWSGADAESWPGLPNRCHTNTARLGYHVGGSRIATGYALSNGEWRQHSWGIDPDGKVMETTSPRDAYFGVLLTEAEAQAFRQANTEYDADHRELDPYAGVHFDLVTRQWVWPTEKEKADPDPPDAAAADTKALGGDASKVADHPETLSRKARMLRLYGEGLPDLDDENTGGRNFLWGDRNRSTAKQEVVARILARIDPETKRQLAEEQGQLNLDNSLSHFTAYFFPKFGDTQIPARDFPARDRFPTDPFDRRVIYQNVQTADAPNPEVFIDSKMLGANFYPDLLQQGNYEDLPTPWAEMIGWGFDPESITSGTQEEDHGHTITYLRGDDPRVMNGLAGMALAQFIHSWADTSNDSNLRALAVQDAIQQEFGLHDAMEWDVKIPVDSRAARNVNDKIEEEKARVPLYRKLVRAQYDETQAWLADHGITEMLVFRGMKWDQRNGQDEVPPLWFDDMLMQPEEMGPDASGKLMPIGSEWRTMATPPLRPASSWAWSGQTAEDFATGGVGDSYRDPNLSGAILRTVVPATAILATPRTGFGCLPEEEVVMLDFGGTVEVKTEGVARRDALRKDQMQRLLADNPTPPLVTDLAHERLDDIVRLISRDPPDQVSATDVSSWYERLFGVAPDDQPDRLVAVAQLRDALKDVDAVPETDKVRESRFNLPPSEMVGLEQALEMYAEGDLADSTILNWYRFVFGEKAVDIHAAVDGLVDAIRRVKESHKEVPA